MVKNKLNYIISLIFIVALVSCSNKKAIEFDNIVSLSVDKIPIAQIFSPTFMTLTEDILTITSYGADEMLHFYKTPMLDYIYSCGPKGQGPDEFQAFPMICQNTSSDRLYIWGYTPISIKEFVFKHDSLKVKSKYDLAHYETFNQLHLVRDSLFIYNAIPSDFSIKKYDIKNNNELGEILMKMDDHNEPFYSSSYGFVAANDSYIIYVYQFKKQIDIYDIESLKLKKQIIGKYEYVTPVIGDNDNNIHQYTNVVAGKTYFYVLYQGRNAKSKIANSDFIEVYDYNGNPIVKYTFDNISPSLFVIDEANNVLYGFSYEYENYLLKCFLKENTN